VGSTDPISTVKVNIMGRQYSMSGDLDPVYMEKLAGQVNTKIAELQKIAPNIDSMQASILASLNFVDELEQLRAQMSGEGVDVVEEKTRKLISMLEKGIIGDEMV